MSFQITGKLVKKMDTEKKGTGSFQTREFVIVTQEQYPQYVKFQLTQDRVSAVDRYNENDEITVHFDLRGREWQGKYFTNLNAWKIETATPNANPAGQQFVGDREAPDPFENAAELTDDLPF